MVCSNQGFRLFSLFDLARTLISYVQSLRYILSKQNPNNIPFIMLAYQKQVLYLVKFYLKYLDIHFRIKQT